MSGISNWHSILTRFYSQYVARIYKFRICYELIEIRVSAILGNELFRGVQISYSDKGRITCTAIFVENQAEDVKRSRWCDV